MTHEVLHSEIEQPLRLLFVHTSALFLKMRSKPFKLVFSVIDLTSMGAVNCKKKNDL